MKFWWLILPPLIDLRKLLNLVCVGGLLTSVVFAQSPVMLTIDTRSPGCVIPADFAGLSFETKAELPDRNGVSGHLFSPANTQLITLFTNSGIRSLRLGGGSVDGLHAAIPSHADIDSVFGFARATRIKVIYSLRLLDGNPAADAATAKYIWTHYRRWLDCFAVGNEPNVKSYRYPPFGWGTDPAITNYMSYLADWRKFAAAITRAAPGAKFAGPDAAGTGWLADFSRDERSSGLVVLITQHEYAGGRPFIERGRKEMPVTQAIDRMLSRRWLADKYLPFYAKTLAHAAVEGLPDRMTEANDYLRGVTNASNAFASALWALDYLHWWAAHGCAGVNFHNKEWLKTDTVYLDASGNYRVNPKAYAIQAFDLGSKGRVEPIAISNPDGLNLTAYAVGEGSRLWVTIINKEHGAGARRAAVTVATDGCRSDQAAVMFLTAPDNNAGAMSGITLGGAAIMNHKPWHGKWTPVQLTADHQWQVAVPAASAAIVKVLLKPE